MSSRDNGSAAGAGKQKRTASPGGQIEPMAKRLKGVHMAAPTRQSLRLNPQSILEVAIDLGTTQISVAYRHRHKGDTGILETPLLHQLISAIPLTRWKDTTHEIHSVDSIIKYFPDGSFKWGHELQVFPGQKIRPEQGVTIEHAKLLLHKSEKTKVEIDGIEATARLLNKDPLEFISDIASGLYEFLIAYFNQYCPLQMKEAPKILWKVGSPASWTDYENGKLLEILAKAGMANASIASEAEATAAYFLALEEEAFHVGDSIVVADLGGGTCDFIAYQTIGVKPLRLMEAGIADSVCCGGVLLDAKFLALVKVKVPNIANGDLKEVVRHFENGPKRLFNGDPNDVEHNGFCYWIRSLEEELDISCDELREHVYDPVVEEIKLAIDNLLRNTEDVRTGGPDQKMILGGGLARNDYIVQKLKDYYSIPQDGVNCFGLVAAPHTSVAPVARGLLLIDPAGGLVQQRRSRQSVGVYTVIPYEEDPFIDRDSCYIWQDNWDPNQFWMQSIQWIVLPNQIVSDRTVRFERQMVIEPTMERMKEIIYFGAAAPPNPDYTPLRTEEAARELMRSMGLSKLKLFWNLEGIPKAQYLHSLVSHDDGRELFVINWVLVVQYKASQATVTVEVKTRDDKRLVTRPRPIKVDLKTVVDDSIALGSLATRHLGDSHARF